MRVRERKRERERERDNIHHLRRGGDKVVQRHLTQMDARMHGSMNRWIAQWILRSPDRKIDISIDGSTVR